MKYCYESADVVRWSVNDDLKDSLWTCVVTVMDSLCGRRVSST